MQMHGMLLTFTVEMNYIQSELSKKIDDELISKTKTESVLYTISSTMSYIRHHDCHNIILRFYKI